MSRVSIQQLEADGAAQLKRADFAYQSYFDSTLLSTAISLPGQNDPILSPALVSTSGYALALSPVSQTPIAVRFGAGGALQKSQTFILAPGAVLRPHNSKPFSSFEWGLPFGWLGGGSAYLWILRSPDAVVSWPTSAPELVIHRMRLQIAADGSASFATALPTRFPWPNMTSGSTAVGSSPLLAAQPTRWALRLRVNNLSAPVDMRISVQNVQSFDSDKSSPPVLSGDTSIFDVTWPQSSGSSLGYPILSIEPPWSMLGGDSAAIALTDNANASLTNAFVDIVRYGRL